MSELYFWVERTDVRVLTDGSRLQISGQFTIPENPVGPPPYGSHTIVPGEDVHSAFRRIVSPYEPTSRNFALKKYEGRGRYWPKPFEFWPRIFTFHSPDDRSKEFILGARQIEILFDELVGIFRFIEPDLNNLDVHGHEIRNLLILACTELEAQFRGILKANNYTFLLKPNGQIQASTNDYVKLLYNMRLNEFKIDFPLYPQIGIREPFLNWTHASPGPTKTLIWYDAYNATKHDRELHFSEASLRNALDAVAACIIIFSAQYGVKSNPLSRIRFVSEPNFELDDNERHFYSQLTPVAQQTNCLFAI